MGILFKKLLAQLLFWIYDFIDTIGTIFNILTGTQSVEENRTLLQVFVESAISTKVLLGLCMVSIVIVGASMGVKTVKNIVRLKSGGEEPSHALTIKQGFFAILSSVVCIFFVLMFIGFSSMLLNMVNGVIAPEENTTLSQNLFNLSVEKSYVIDESVWYEREVDYLDETGHKVQATDEDGNKLYETDAEGNLIYDDEGDPIPVWVKKIEYYHPYKYEDGKIVTESGWVIKEDDTRWSASDIDWSMSPDEVFGIHNKDWIGIFEQEDQGYKVQPMVRLESFNMFTAYLVAIVLFISMFMLCVGLVKRIYDIIVLIICMPLVCGTIPLDDGARFRAWRETFMSKVLVAFGAVISLNVFYMVSRFIVGTELDFTYLVNEGILSSSGISVFKMLLLLGGALCMNGSQALIARILGTSADESREAMQSFALISSGVRLGAAGALGAGRIAMGAKRMTIGGTNRYGRQRTGAIPLMFRGANAIGERAGGERYTASRGAAFVRKLGRMGGRNSNYLRTAGATAGAGGGSANANSESALGIRAILGLDKPNIGEHKNSSAPYVSNGIAGSTNGNLGRPGSLAQPQSINNINTTVVGEKPQSSIRPTNGGLRTNDSGNKSSAYNDSGSRKRKN